jgi:hypothetical protein
MRKVVLIGLLTIIVALGASGQSSGADKIQGTEAVKIKITIGEKTLAATMADNVTAREFLELLPFSMKLNDYAGREKYGHCDNPLSEYANGRQKTYKIGDIGYWSPNNDFAIFYSHDGTEMPEPGITVIGTIDSGIDVFDAEGAITATFEAWIYTPGATERK